MYKFCLKGYEGEPPKDDKEYLVYTGVYWHIVTFYGNHFRECDNVVTGITKWVDLGSGFINQEMVLQNLQSISDLDQESGLYD